MFRFSNVTSIISNNVYKLSLSYKLLLSYKLFLSEEADDIFLLIILISLITWSFMGELEAYFNFFKIFIRILLRFYEL